MAIREEIESTAVPAHLLVVVPKNSAELIKEQQARFEKMMPLPVGGAGQ